MIFVDSQKYYNSGHKPLFILLGLFLALLAFTSAHMELSVENSLCDGEVIRGVAGVSMIDVSSYCNSESDTRFVEGLGSLRFHSAILSMLIFLAFFFTAIHFAKCYVSNESRAMSIAACITMTLFFAVGFSKVVLM